MSSANFLVVYETDTTNKTPIYDALTYTMLRIFMDSFELQQLSLSGIEDNDTAGVCLQKRYMLQHIMENKNDNILYEVKIMHQV